MNYPTHLTQPKRPGQQSKRINPLKYTFDSQFSPKTPPDDDADDDDPITMESGHSDSETGRSSDSGYSEPRGIASLSASFQLIADTMLRTELAELEMMKKRETARLEAEKRQAELEDEMSQMILQTQSHIASFACQTSSSRKRKSTEADDSSSTSGTNMYKV